MNTSNTPEIQRQINNLCAQIKTHYPHLYEETGGKYIRKLLRAMLEANASDASHFHGPVKHAAKNYPSNNFVERRIARNKHSQQAA